MRSTLSPTVSLWSILIAAASTQGAPILSAEPAPGGLSQTFPAGRDYQVYPSHTKRHLEDSKLAILELLNKRTGALPRWTNIGPSKQGDGGAKKPQHLENAGVEEQESDTANALKSGAYDNAAEPANAPHKPASDWFWNIYAESPWSPLKPSGRYSIRPTGVDGRNNAANRLWYGQGMEKGKPANLPEEGEDGSTRPNRDLRYGSQKGYDPENWPRYDKVVEKAKPANLPEEGEYGSTRPNRDMRYGSQKGYDPESWPRYDKVAEKAKLANKSQKGYKSIQPIGQPKKLGEDIPPIDDEIEW